MNIQNKFKKTNTIYKITKDMDLEGSTLIIPVGCTLDFQGGSFKNGTIEGNGTAIQSELRKIFDDNVVLEGVWDIKEAYPEWFGGKGDGITDNTQAIKNCIKYFTNTYVSAGTYITNQIDDIPSFRTIRGCGKKSIIQANPSMELTNGYLLRTKDGGSGITFSDFVLLGGSNSTESNYKIGGIALRSTSNDVNDQWDTRNIIQNVEIKYCYAASIYVGTYQRENKISNCFITHTTNIGINCMGTDNMIIGCTVASSHHEGIVINGNNRVDSCKCFGCGASSTVTGKYALSLIGSKCNVSNVELQQNNYGGCIIQGNSNYVQITCDNNGSGTTNTVLGCHVVGSYNTVSVTSYNFSFHDNQYERYFVSTNWNTVGNNITVNGTPLQKNKMSALSPWSVDNICNNIMWNGYNITQSREVPFDKLVLPDLFRSNGTGSFYVNDSGLSFKLTSVTAVNVDALVQAISIHNSNAIDPDGCFSVKARFHKDGDIDTSVYPIIRVITRYKDSSGTTLTRVDQNTTVNLLDNKDSLDVYALTQYHYLSDKPASILSVSVEFAIRSTKLLSDVSINAYFDDIKIGATTSGNKVKFVNTNIDGTLASKVIIANKLSDFTQENTIYKITTDLNLNTAILELPANCTLDFQGGSISNGTIIGNETKIEGNVKIKCFLSGTYKGNIDGCWFIHDAADNTDELQNFFNLLSANNIGFFSRKVDVKISSAISVKSNTSVDFENCFIYQLSNSAVLANEARSTTYDNINISISNLHMYNTTTNVISMGAIIMRGVKNLKIENFYYTSNVTPPDPRTRNWALTISGIDIYMNNINIDNYITGIWSDGIHFEYVKDLILTNFNIKSGDDCIAINPQDTADKLGGYLPNVNSNIVISNGICASNRGNILRIGAGGDTISPDYYVENVTVNNITVTGEGTNPLISLQDFRTVVPNNLNNNILVSNIKGAANATGNTKTIAIEGTYLPAIDYVWNNIVFENLNLTTEGTGTRIRVYNTVGIVFKDCTINLKGDTEINPYKILSRSTKSLTFKGCTISSNQNTGRIIRLSNNYEVSINDCNIFNYNETNTSIAIDIADISETNQFSESASNRTLKIQDCIIKGVGSTLEMPTDDIILFGIGQFKDNILIDAPNAVSTILNHFNDLNCGIKDIILLANTLPAITSVKGLRLGTYTYDLNLHRPKFAGVNTDNTITYYDAYGYTYGRVKGSTDQRPSLTNTDAGFQFYDNVLKKTILWNGTAWTNLDGTALT